MRVLLVLPLLVLVALSGCAAKRGIADLSYTAQDYSFTGPDQVTGDTVALHLSNQGHEAHHIAIARLDAGHTKDELVQVLTASNGEEMVPWAHWVGGVGPFLPGASGVAYLSLTPGTYVLLCFVPDMHGMPHFMHGMSKQLTVVAPSGAAPDDPAADTVLTQNDFSFSFDHDLTAGTHTIRVENHGAQVHEAILVHLNAGATGQDFVAAFGPNATGPPPGAFVGGFSEQDPGRHGEFTVDLATGHYVLLCFVTDPQSKAPHFALGMMKEFAIS